MITKKTQTIKHALVCLTGLVLFNVQMMISQNTIYVDNGKIYSSCNEEIVMRGVNEMFIWSQDRTGATILPEIKQTGSNAVRLVWTTQGSETELDALIGNSIANNMIPVAELHDATGDFSKLPLLLEYWKRPAILATIQKYKKWLIVNVGNEIGNGSESTAQWVAHYKDAITQLRDAGVDTPIMIDCGTWGNQESYFLEGGNELLDFDPDHNLIFSIHTYWTNGGDAAKIARLNTMIADAKQKKLPYIVGEGPQLASSPNICGDIFPYKEMIKRMEEEKIGWLAWSWGAVDNSDCGAPNSVFDITLDGKFGNWATPFAEDICVADPNSIKNTSIIPPSMLNDGIACGVNYTINATASVGGTISPTGTATVSEKTDKTYTITANSGFKIEDVKVNGTSVGAVATYTFKNVTSNGTISATFSETPVTQYTITATAGANGVISPAGNTSVNQGANQSYDIIANRGYEIDAITVDGSNITDIGIKYTFTNVQANHNIAATFKAIPVSVAQQAYPNGIPHSIPGTIEATNYDIGGEGIAYHETTTGNAGPGIRQNENVDTEFKLASGNVGWVDTSEWLEYTVNVSQAGSYTIETLVASNTTTGAYHIEFDGSDVTGIQRVPSTGEWNTFITQTIPNVALNSGTQIMRVYMDGGAFNIASIKLSSSTPTPDENSNPIAVLNSNVISGTTPLIVTFNASGSTDADGDSLTYSWDFGDNTTGAGATISHTYTTAGAYNATVTVQDEKGGSDQESVVITATTAGNPRTNDCAFGTPSIAALPTGSYTYNNIHVLGTGGPNLSNVINFGINWGLQNNGLWQLSMSTNNGSPNWWINLLNAVTQNLNSTQPSMQFLGTGITGFDGDYYVNFVGADFVMVSKTDDYSIYFSNSSTPPNCDSQGAKSITDAIVSLSVYPNPSSTYFVLQTTGEAIQIDSINLYDVSGRQISDLTNQFFNNQLNFGEDLASGIYFVRINSGIDTNVIKVIKK